MLNGIDWATSVSRQVSSQFKETISAVWGEPASGKIHVFGGSVGIGPKHNS